MRLFSGGADIGYFAKLTEQLSMKPVMAIINAEDAQTVISHPTRRAFGY